MTRVGAAALGSPIGHSLSPVLHHAAYEALGLSEWTFRTIECVEAELASTLHRLDDEGLAGVGLTMPLKRAVMPMLSTADEWAVRTAAANTVVFGAAGAGWTGANTDVPGMIAVLRSAEVQSGDGPAWVLGAGATAGSALAALADLGHARAVVIARRLAAAEDLRAVAARVGLEVEVRPWTEFGDLHSATLVIAATPAGATDSLAVDLSEVSGLLFDVVYSPWPTALASAWQDAGGRAVGGLELLVEQAVVQVQLMTGQTPPTEAMRQAGYTALRSR